MNERKVIITKYENKICSFLIHNNRLIAVNTLDNDSKINSIYVGKVKNVLHNIQACFVEIANKESCFLPFRELTNAFCINRSLRGLPVQGDELLVQVTNDASKNKQTSVSCNINYTGNLFVFTANNQTLGISSKLSKEDRESIKVTLRKNNILDDMGNHITPENAIISQFGCIVRTQAADVLATSEETFINIYQQELTMFLSFYKKALHATCFQCIYAPNLPYESLLDSYASNEYDEIVTDIEEAYTLLQGHTKSIRLYTDPDYSLIRLYSLKSKVNEALSKCVWLNSGANLIIESTECLTTIDVNSAKSIKGELFAENIQKLNLEAAKEAALQIRLRNLSGIILIDFINMEDKNAENSIIEYMKKLVSYDNITTNIIDITPLGLMEITRKKIFKTLSEQLKG